MARPTSNSSGSVPRPRRWWLPAALALALAVLGAGEAAAKITTHVVNCTSAALEANSYDAKDGARAIPSHQQSWDENEPGTSHHMSCRGQGRGYCQVEIKGEGEIAKHMCPRGTGDGLAFHLFHAHKDKYQLVIGFEYDPHNPDRCKPRILENQDDGNCGD